MIILLCGEECHQHEESATIEAGDIFRNGLVEIWERILILYLMMLEHLFACHVIYREENAAFLQVLVEVLICLYPAGGLVQDPEHVPPGHGIPIGNASWVLEGTVGLQISGLRPGWRE